MGDANEVEVFDSPDLLSSYAHLFLCGCSGYALTRLSAEQSPFAFTAACVFFGHGCIGVAAKYHTSTGFSNQIKAVYRWSRMLVHSAPLPCINAQLCINQNQELLFTRCYLASVLPTFVSQLSHRGSALTIETERVLDLVVLGNLSGLGYSSVMHDDYLGLALAGWYFVMQFVVPWISEWSGMSRIDEEDLKTTCLGGVPILLSQLFASSQE